MKNVLECSNVCKKYNDNYILNNIDLNIKEGEIVGLIGKNGVGKTTLIKVILNLTNIDDGIINICGYNKDINSLKSIGAIIENPTFYDYLTGYDNLYLESDNIDNITGVIDLLNLHSYINKKVKNYSLGMKQKLGIACTLVNNPKLVILDEPTNGLDPEAIIDLRNILFNLKKEKVGILISSHNLKELESFCDSIYLLNKSKLEKIENPANDYYLISVDSVDIHDNNLFEIVDKNTLKTTELIKTIDYLKDNNINILSIKNNLESLEDKFTSLVGVQND
ncbi:MAG: ABC transporter ATP-binding protein [Bacilli bacterium]|nr:ABC transporter ATP-binding protein [Bacilli bacterium]